MKNLKLVIVMLCLILISCQGSESYQGKWKALDTKGKKYEIVFSPTNVSIIDSLGKSTKYNYIQNSFKHENSVDTYGIKLSDGRGYEIYFPKEDESVGLIRDENGVQMFTISRNNYLKYEDIYKLN